MLEPLFEADKAAKINRTRGEDEKGFFLDQPADNKRGQDGLIPQLYARAPTQTTFVPITGYFPVKSLNKRQPLSLCLFFFSSFFFKRSRAKHICCICSFSSHTCFC